MGGTAICASRRRSEYSCACTVIPAEFKSVVLQLISSNLLIFELCGVFFLHCGDRRHFWSLAPIVRRGSNMVNCTFKEIEFRCKKRLLFDFFLNKHLSHLNTCQIVQIYRTGQKHLLLHRIFHVFDIFPLTKWSVLISSWGFGSLFHKGCGILFFLPKTKHSIGQIGGAENCFLPW